VTSFLAYDSSWAVESGMPLWAIIAFGVFLLLIVASWALDDILRKRREDMPTKEPDGPRFPHLKD